MKKIFEFFICIMLVDIVFFGVTTGSSNINSIECENITNYNTVSSCVTLSNGFYWAIIICGSNDFNNGFETDLKDMYQLLKNNLGYDDDHIYYVAPQNWDQVTHYYSISKNNIQQSIQDVANRVSNDDNLFFYYTAHGASDYLDGDGDKIANEPADDIYAPTLDGWLDSVDVKQMIIVLQGCYCGSFINDLSQSKRIIITATDSTHSSWADMNGWQDPPGASWDPNGPNDDGAWNHQNINWDGSEFSSGFRMSFRDIDTDGRKEADDDVYINTPGNSPDIQAPSGNKNGKVSVLEAFNFADFEDCLSLYWTSYIPPTGNQEYPQMDYTTIDPSTTYIYNDPPDKPAKPSGQISGKIGVEYTYSSVTTDIDGDEVYYWFDWGDGTNSGWIGPYASGATGTAKHAWTSKGEYKVKVKAKDHLYDAESSWSDLLTVTMPRNKGIHITSFLDLLQKFLQSHPNIFPILKHLFKL